MYRSRGSVHGRWQHPLRPSRFPSIGYFMEMGATSLGLLVVIAIFPVIVWFGLPIRGYGYRKEKWEMFGNAGSDIRGCVYVLTVGVFGWVYFSESWVGCLVGMAHAGVMAMFTGLLAYFDMVKVDVASAANTVTLNSIKILPT